MNPDSNQFPKFLGYNVVACVSVQSPGASAVRTNNVVMLRLAGTVTPLWQVEHGLPERNSFALTTSTLGFSRVVLTRQLTGGGACPLKQPLMVVQLVNKNERILLLRTHQVIRFGQIKPRVRLDPSSDDFLFLKKALALVHILSSGGIETSRLGMTAFRAAF